MSLHSTDSSTLTTEWSIEDAAYSSLHGLEEPPLPIQQNRHDGVERLNKGCERRTTEYQRNGQCGRLEMKSLRMCLSD